MTEAAHIVIAFSSGLLNKRLIKNTLDRLLGSLAPAKITLINDKASLFDPKWVGSSVKIDQKTPKMRIEFRRIVAEATHVVVFWSGEDLHEIIWEARHQKKPLRISTFALTTVVNKDAGKEFDVYIGRGGPWGNPFPIVPGTEETRERVIERYAEYFENEVLSNPKTRHAVLELRGLRLACHCKPEPCHGDIIARYLNNYSECEEPKT